MRRTKTGRQPRGVLLVPVFKDAEVETAGPNAPTGEAQPEDVQPEDTGVVEDSAVEDTRAGEPALEEETLQRSARTTSRPRAWLPR